ncbi:MAG: hotdog fold thioesterase [Desulfuromonadales bacterium]|jgi:acyl-CoA thioesterase|nr:hotdog fold thioesterase [Desulfuromonadales bacterium]
MQKIRDHFDRNDLFARHCGIELLEIDKGRARARMQVKEIHINGARTVHGGAIFTLADFAFAAASNSHGDLAMGISTSTSFVRAATEGVLYATAEEVSLSRKLATYQVRVTDQEDELIALFQGTVYRKPVPLTD